MQAIQLTNLEKRFGQRKILSGLNLTISPGETVALLAPNGSGKSTLFKVLTGLQRPTGGSVQVLGQQAGSVQTQVSTAYLPEETFLYRWMRVGEMADFYAGFYEDFDGERWQDLLNFMELNPSTQLTTLSFGLMRRLELALILSRNASLLLLDEPFSGIDLISREKIYQALIRQHRFGEASMLISTHLVDEIEKLAERVIFLKGGSIILDINLEEWKQEHHRSLRELFWEVYTK